jgi:hypothetical protein
MSWHWLDFAVGAVAGFLSIWVGYWLGKKLRRWRTPKPPTLPEPLSREDYQALPDEEKQARRDQFKAYCDFYDPDYPRREQLTSGNQRYADSQRVEGINPPGIYC